MNRLFSSSCPNFGNLRPVGGGGMEGTPLFSFWRADSILSVRLLVASVPSGLVFPRPRAVLEHRAQVSPTPVPQPPPVGGPPLGRGMNCPQPWEGSLSNGGKRGWGWALWWGDRGMGEHFSLVLKHLRSCSQGFFWAVVVRGPGRGGRGQARPGLGTSRSTVISCRGLTSAGEQEKSVVERAVCHGGEDRSWGMVDFIP